ncbi:MAG: MATE family efflux transporter [Proteobacteria bacterium]|nr:MATE family efflux transporter [Pseudomonadota bacterium]
MTAPTEARKPPIPGRLPLSQHIIRHLRLAVPVMLARAGLFVMISVDSIMTGRAGAATLAHYAISLAPQVTLLVLGIGLLVGTVVLTAQADGAGRSRDCGPIWTTSLWIGAVLGAASGVVLLWGEPILLLFGQSPELARGGGRALLMAAGGMPAILMYLATTFFLEGIGRPKVGMMVALTANLLNAGLNWVLIYGNLGAPEMGAAGATLATTITRWVMLAALLGYAFTMSDGARYGVRAAAVSRLSVARKVFRIGAPLSVAIALESACFSTVAIFAGRLGEIPLAGYQIAFNVVTLAFMLAIGLSTATSVRVANAVGRSDHEGMAMAGWTGVGLVAFLMLAVALAIRLLDAEIATLYSTEAAVLEHAVSALTVAAFVVVVDGTQAVTLGALRGTGNVLLPTLIYAVSFWVVAVPAAYFVGLKGDAGIEGLLWSVFAGLCCALALLAWRFAAVARRPVTPI